MSKQTLTAYWEDYSMFDVPAGIDLRSGSVCWYVRWGTLHIEHKDGRTWEIEACDGPQLKSPERCTLTTEDGDEEDVGFNDAFYSSSESEESESEEEESDEEDDKEDKKD